MDFHAILVFAPVLLLAITVHEFAHAWMANRLGDPTARLEGRLTLNPVAHLDPLGTLCLFIANFGWGKPVPVNSRNFKHPLWDDMLVSACGPLSNFLTAFLLGVVFQFAITHNLIPFRSYLYDVLRLGLVINLCLCFFNLLPLYPLDGSHILKGLLPRGMVMGFEKINSYSPFVLLGILIMGPMFQVSFFGEILGPPVYFFARLFTNIL